jgi:hypothetical protein
MYLDESETLICIEVVVTKEENQHKLVCAPSPKRSSTISQFISHKEDLVRI